MGSKGSQTSSTTSSLPPEVLQNYQNVVNQAQTTAATPYQQYSGQLVAPENATEQAATTAATNAQGTYQPYFDQAQNYINTGTTPITPSSIDASTIAQYESPYNQQVINATQAQLNQNDAVQQQQLKGNAIAAGAFGGDRAAVAASTLAGQQDLANNQTIAGLENQNYTQALGEANTQQQAGMTAQQANNANALQASGLSGALGNNAQNNELSGASAEMAAGQIGQQTQQNENTAGYQQFEQQLAYPFQNTQYLANIVEGLGNQGGTSTTTSPSTQSNSVLGFLGLKSGGSVDKYDNGGGVTDFENSYVPMQGISGGGSSIPSAPPAPSPDGGSGGLDMGSLAQTAIKTAPEWLPMLMSFMNTGGSVKGYADGGATLPDFQTSYVPSASGGIGGGANSIPNAPNPTSNGQQQPKPNLNGLVDTAKNIYGGYKSVKGAYGAAQASKAADGAFNDFLNGSGTAAMADSTATAADAAAASSPEWLTSIMSFFKTGGAVGGRYASGGIVPKGYATDGAVTPPPFSWGDPNTIGMGISGYNNSSPLTSTINQMSGLQNFTPVPIDFGKGYIPTSPQMSMEPQQSSIPTAPTISNAAASSQSIQAPQSLTDLQDQLSKTAPALDKDTAIWQGVAGALAGKNRGILQNVGEGLEKGIDTYSQQKSAVADYSLKEAAAQKAAEQMQIEADRYNKQAQIEQENADTNRDYKNIVGNQKQVGNVENQQWEAYQKSHPELSADDQISGFTKLTTKPSASAASGLNIAGMFSHPETATDPSVTGMNVLNDIKDPNQKAMARSILDHTANLNDFSMKGADREQMAGVLHRIDPNYDEHDYQNIGAALKAYNANGNIGKVNNSYSTVIEHIGEALPQAKSLDNEAVWTPANSIENYIANNRGDARIKVLDSTLNNVASEMAKALNPNGVVSDAAREEQRHNLNANIDSTGQISAVLKNLATLGKDKINTNQQQYLSDAGDSDYRRQKADNFVTPNAKAVLGSLGIQIPKMYGRQLPSASSSSPAPTYKKGMTATGPNSAKLVFDGNGWVKQ